MMMPEHLPVHQVRQGHRAARVDQLDHGSRDVPEQPLGNVAVSVDSDVKDLRHACVLMVAAELMIAHRQYSPSHDAPQLRALPLHCFC
jgi:hypothetical protein